MKDTCPMNEVRLKVIQEAVDSVVEEQLRKNVTIDDMIEVFDKIYEHYDAIKDARKSAGEYSKSKGDKK